MKSVRAATCIVALVLLAPATALAASGMRAQELLVAGNTRLEGDVAAFFFTSNADGFSWELTADSAELLREHADWRAVDNPLTPAYDVFRADAWERETLAYAGPVRLSSSETIGLGAMLALADPGAHVAASSSGLLQIRAARDPVLVQDLPSDADTEDDVQGFIRHQLAGDFLDATFAEGTYTITGDLTLVMYGPAYALEADGETVAWETGEYETSRTALLVEGRQERHTLALTGALLQVRALEPARVVTTFPTLEIDGTLKAPQAEGALVVAGRTLTPPADGSPLTFLGAGALALAFSDGRVGMSSPDMVATAAAIAPQGPPLFAIGAAALLAIAALAGLVLAWQRRSRADDLELALLAMEERRWEDALPRLARVARRQPDNVAIVVDRALCLEQVGRLEEAARSFEAALRAAPALAEAHFYYARTLAKMRQRDAARAHLEEALERDPRLAELMRAEPALRGL